MKKLRHDQVVEFLKQRQGRRSLREFARELDISAVYLSHIYNGKREPGPAVLDKLGLQREVVYRALSH
jgi:transcriptional regulator with XRE-family HTH domain